MAKDFQMEWRVNAMGKEECFITIKDHKEDFPSRIIYRLINPAKCEMGRISKEGLQRINSDIRKNNVYNRLRSTNVV